LRQLDPLRNRVEKQVSPACLLAHPEQGCTEGVLMMNYLPKDATIEQACNWLQAKTGETWILQRLIECGLRPHFWLDYSPGLPAIFGDRLEGFQTSMVFQGDLTRLEADGADALVTMFTAHDGKLIKTEPGWRVPLSDLRFKRFDIERIAEIVNRDTAPATDAAPESATASKPVTDWAALAQQKARDHIKQQRDRDLYPSQEAIGDWVASEFRKTGIVGADGKPLSGATIKRHALKGISSAVGKQLSTVIVRGK